jgi:hypothetical protein
MTDNEFLETMKKYREEQEQRAESARSKLMHALQAAGVKKVVASFDGYGDSGNVETIAYEPATDGSAEVSDSPHQVTDWPQDGEPQRTVRNYTLDELVEEVCYALLGTGHPGWEINSGSYGEFLIDPAANSVRLTFNERIESVETSEEEY